MFQECGKKDSEQCRGKDRALLHATEDAKRVGSGSIVHNCSIHVTMKGFHDAECDRRTTDLGQDLEKSSLFPKSNALAKSMKAI